MSTNTFSITLLLAWTALGVAVGGCSSPATSRDDGLLPLDRLAAPTSSCDSTDSGSSDSDCALVDRPETPSEDEELLEWLSKSLWSRSTRPLEEEESDYRWIYPSLEDLLSENAESRQLLRAHVNSDEPIVAANAAIELMRMGDNSVAEQVAEAAGNGRLDIPLRCGAAETLGRAPNGVALLSRLIDEETKRPRNTYSPACHAELILALGRCAKPRDNPRLATALSAQADEVKLAALRIWQDLPASVFPEQGLALSSHSNPTIRAELLTALARHPAERTLEYLTLGLRDPELRVRTSAIQAMGTLGDERAAATLEPLLLGGVEGERIAAVEALSHLGQAEAVMGAVQDESWRVRLAVTETLPDLPEASHVALAKRLLDDASAEVQHRTVETIQEWPPATAEPLLLDALEDCPYRSQKLAVVSLAETWPEGRTLLEVFPFGQSARVRDQAVQRVREAYAGREDLLVESPTRQQVSYSPEQLAPVVAALRVLHAGAVDTSGYSEAISSLRNVGPTLAAKLEYLVDKQGIVLPDSVFDLLASERPEFATIERLGQPDVRGRRDAAREMAEKLARRPLRPLMIHRLADLAIAETDAVVWQYLLAALADQSDSGTFRLVYAAAGHNSAGVRLAACEHLQRHPHPNHAAILLATLNDRSAPVTCAALDALSACGGNVDPEPILLLLKEPSETVRVTAAATLSHLGRPEGPAALERLAYSHDEHIRLQVARAMGELALPEFAPTLVRLLDDRHGIRVAALNSLSRVANCEEAQAEDLRESERIEAWRRWALREYAPMR